MATENYRKVRHSYPNAVLFFDRNLDHKIMFCVAKVNHETKKIKEFKLYGCDTEKDSDATEIVNEKMLALFKPEWEERISSGRSKYVVTFPILPSYPLHVYVDENGKLHAKTKFKEPHAGFHKVHRIQINLLELPPFLHSVFMHGETVERVALKEKLDSPTMDWKTILLS